MGMSVGTGAASGGSAPMADINVTPLIDVMLVLLIIFMINVPVVTYRVQIDLPQPTVTPPELVETDEITIRINDDNSIQWDDMPMNLQQIDYRLRQASRQNPQPRILVSAGDRSRYQVLAEIMTKAKNADIRRIGFDNTQR